MADSGIVVTRRGCINLFTADLSGEIWRVTVDGWSNDALIADDRLYCGVIEERIKEFSVCDGGLVRSFPYEGGSIAALEDNVCILLRAGFIEAVDWSGRRLWSVKIAPGDLKAHAASRLYASASEPFRRAVLCIDASMGEVLWKREPPAEGRGDAAMMSNTISSVAVVDERVLVIPRDGRRLFVLSAEDGEIQSINSLPTLPVRGQYLVTEQEVILFHPYAVSFFDHREMRETRRIDLRADVEPLYGGRPPLSRGVCLTRDSVIWTAPHGAFMGITLEPGPDGRRTTWVEEVPGALIPQGIPPVVHDNYMYYTNMGEPLELMCYVGDSGAT